MQKDIDIKRQHHAVPAMTGSWRDFRQEMNRLFDRFSDGLGSLSLEPYTNLRGLFEPPASSFAHLSVDVAENGKAYTITAELPGVDEKNVEVSVRDDMLIIKGEKRQEHEDVNDNHYIAERSFGSFRRMFTLPRDTETGKIEANFKNGILTVTVPKGAEKQQSRKVEIKAA